MTKKPHAGTRLAQYVERPVLEIKPKKSQLQIASEAGFPNPNMVIMIKNGTSKLALDRVPSMARALECDPAYLMRLSLELMGWIAPAPTGVAMRHTAGVKICN